VIDPKPFCNVGRRPRQSARWGSNRQDIHDVRNVQTEPSRPGSPARFGSARRGFPSAASWVLNSDIRLQAAVASSRLLMLMGLYNMALHKPRLA
jgi:hypothetical protein